MMEALVNSDTPSVIAEAVQPIIVETQFAIIAAMEQIDSEIQPVLTELVEPVDANAQQFVDVESVCSFLVTVTATTLGVQSI